MARSCCHDERISRRRKFPVADRSQCARLARAIAASDQDLAFACFDRFENFFQLASDMDAEFFFGKGFEVDSRWSIVDSHERERESKKGNSRTDFSP
jgi:hypothetical protein